MWKTASSIKSSTWSLFVIVLCLNIRSCNSTTCYSCVGADCNYGECTGDICFSGLHPVGPFTSESPLHIKGCVRGSKNKTASFLNRTIEAFSISSEAYFCEWDLCNAPKYVAKHAKSLHARQDEQRYAVCKLATPFENSGDDVCLGEWCWVGHVRARSALEETILRGCSGMSLGVLTGSYCISPPVVDLVAHVPLYAMNNDSIVCFCKGLLCNKGLPPSLEYSSPLMSVSVKYTQPLGIEVTGKGNVWLMDRKQTLPEPVFYILSGPGFQVEVTTEWTPAGQDFHDWTLSTTLKPPADGVPEDNAEDAEEPIANSTSGDGVELAVAISKDESTDISNATTLKPKKPSVGEQKASASKNGLGDPPEPSDDDVDLPSNGVESRVNLFGVVTIWICLLGELLVMNEHE